MTLPLSGPLTLTDIQNEFGGTAPIGLSEYYRGGPYVPASINTTTVPSSGPLSVSNFYGTAKRVTVPVSINSPAINFDVYANRGPNYVAGVSDVVVNVSSGVVVGSSSSSSYAMSITNSFDPGDTVTLNNSGTIIGTGGPGGAGNFAYTPGDPGASGGNALYVSRPTTVYNYATIAGGGGGGGGGGGWVPNKGPDRWGGGGGGGAGYYAGGGGGGAYPGNPGSTTDGGAGVGADGGGSGGNGGGQGSPGGSGVGVTGGGGGGGSAGYYIVGNSFITWNATGNRFGPAA